MDIDTIPRASDVRTRATDGVPPEKKLFLADVEFVVNGFVKEAGVALKRAAYLSRTDAWFDISAVVRDSKMDFWKHLANSGRREEPLGSHILCAATLEFAKGLKQLGYRVDVRYEDASLMDALQKKQCPQDIQYAMIRLDFSKP